MRFPFVWRAELVAAQTISDAIKADYNRLVDEYNDRTDYDALLARYDALLEKYHALRVQGATVTRPLPAASPAPRTPEERMVTEADAEYEANAVRALVSQGASEADARMIAKAMRADLTTRSLSVPGMDWS